MHEIPTCLSRLNIRPVTQGLVLNLLCNDPLSPAQIVDFSVSSQCHYLALRAALLRVFLSSKWIRFGRVSETDLTPSQRRVVRDLDAAIGNGDKIQAFVAKYAKSHATLSFQTAWDGTFNRLGSAPTQSGC